MQLPEQHLSICLTHFATPDVEEVFPGSTATVRRQQASKVSKKYESRNAHHAPRSDALVLIVESLSEGKTIRTYSKDRSSGEQDVDKIVSSFGFGRCCWSDGGRERRPTSHAVQIAPGEASSPVKGRTPNILRRKDLSISTVIIDVL